MVARMTICGVALGVLIAVLIEILIEISGYAGGGA
jgi:hypothetical protein